MRRLQFEDRDVTTSSMSQKAYRAAPCDLLLVVTPQNQDAALTEFKHCGELGKYRGLHVSGIDDLSFLQEFPQLLYLELAGHKSINIRDLSGLENLRGLHVESPGSGIDFASFPQLEVYMGGWHAGHKNLASCQELRRLKIRNVNPRSNNLAALADVTRLEDVQITQSNIKSLAGIETLGDLRYFDIAYASKLQSLDALKHGVAGLRELSIEKCRKIASYEPIAALTQLRRLKLTGCAQMKNLRWVGGLKDLDFFSFVDTSVQDGDLSHLLKLPKLRYVGSLDKKRYNFKVDALNIVLQR